MLKKRVSVRDKRETHQPGATIVSHSDDEAWEELVERVRYRRARFAQLYSQQIDDIIEQDFQRISDPSVREGVVYGVLRDLGRSYEEVVGALEDRRKRRRRPDRSIWAKRLVRLLSFEK
jgi:hypothetical protein